MQEKHPKAQQAATGFVEHVIALEQRLIEALSMLLDHKGFVLAFDLIQGHRKRRRDFLQSAVLCLLNIQKKL